MHPLRGALRGGAAVLSLLAATATAATAQGFALNAQGGYFGMKASDSAKAVFDSAGGFTGGGGLSYAFGKHLYVEAGARYFSTTGEKVFVAAPGDAVFKLGFPVKARLVPIYGTIGYRFAGKSALVPYLGVGGGVTSYHEESTVAGTLTTESQSKASFHGLLGLEYGRGHLRVAVEGLYTAVPNAIGVGGVSKVYGEDDLGGFVALGKLIYSFGTR
jgi:Outer membrane protein beta-barrel domain